MNAARLSILDVSGKPRSNERPALTNFFATQAFPLLLSRRNPSKNQHSFQISITTLLLACAFLQPRGNVRPRQQWRRHLRQRERSRQPPRPNASVEVREVTTNLLYTTHTNAQGHYSLPVLPVGHYTITVHAPGFADYRRTEVALDTDDALAVDASLLVAAGNETVTVTDSPAHIDVDNTQLGEVISRQADDRRTSQRPQLYRPPLTSGRRRLPSAQSPTRPCRTCGAAALSPSGDLNPRHYLHQRPARVRQRLPRQRSRHRRRRQLRTTIVPNLDSIAEFRILTANFDAQYGGFSGGQIKVITKSGSNAFHGNVFEFLRNTSLDARNYFSPTRGDLQAQNQFGGTFGGPIRKDRAFFLCGLSRHPANPRRRYRPHPSPFEPGPRGQSDRQHLRTPPAPSQGPVLRLCSISEARLHSHRRRTLLRARLHLANPMRTPQRSHPTKRILPPRSKSSAVHPPTPPTSAPPASPPPPQARSCATTRGALRTDIQNPVGPALGLLLPR